MTSDGTTPGAGDLHGAEGPSVYGLPSPNQQVNRKPLDAGLGYVARGWRIFPCHTIVRGRCTCGRNECPSPGKHPRTQNGFKDATTDPHLIEDWATRWPELNWALATGEASGLFVVDIDPRNSGFVSIERFEDERGDALPQTLTALTGGGGRHLFYLYPAGGLPGRKPWIAGVDIKSDGGYVILPEGQHISGGSYRWIDPAVAPVAAPSDLLQGIRSTGRANAHDDTVDLSDVLSGAPEGKRDDLLFRYACRLRSQHGTDADGGRKAVTLLVLAAASQCTPPFPQGQAIAKVEQAYRQDHLEFEPWMAAVASNLTRPISITARQDRARPGGTFILDEPEKIPSIWGDGERVLWAEGEGVMITGHQGVGKTTLAQQVVLHRLGLRAGGLAGLSVAVTHRPIVYLAMDRPRQAARSFRRMVEEAQREALNTGLIVWRGPLPGDPSKRDYLADMVQDLAPDVGTVIVDSVKDLMPGIAKDEVGAALQSSWQEVVTRGIELMLLHHERKAGSESHRTHRLDDVYGSTWLTSGLGSVIAINGDPGDPTVELRHLKQPAEPVGPLTIRHDHATGTTSLVDAIPTVLEVVQWARANGVTAQAVAEQVYGRIANAELQKTRRALRKLEQDGLVIKLAGQRVSGGSEPDVWRISDAATWAYQRPVTT
jgi:replicative DNA helicase